MSDSEDILGGALRAKPPSSTSAFIRYPLYFAFLLILWLASVWSWNSFKARQELNHRLSMRRRHGIPDDDRRPFSVAYATVLHARQKREQEERKAMDEARLRAEMEKERAALEAASAEASRTTATEPRPLAEPLGDSRPHQELQNVTYRRPFYAPPPDSAQLDSRFDPTIQLPRRKKNIRFSESTALQDHHRKPKRAYESDDGDYDAKKTRIEDRDETGQRNGKRMITDDEVEMAFERREKKDGRRPMIIDLDADEEMAQVEVRKVRSPESRGKKRERRVEEEEVASGDEAKSRKERKRRTMHKRKSDAASEKKGKRKRDRDVEMDTDDEEPSKPKSRKTRGKKENIEVEIEEDSDVSMDTPIISQDPLCKGRRVGERWIANGIKYKVGKNGERLRQALVRGSRSRYVMPRDSQHPDRRANLEVFIETWLTEEAYQKAKDRQELAWQISYPPSPESSPPPVNQTTQDSPQTEPQEQGGKDLLWSSTASSTRSVSSRNSPRLSLPTFTSRRVSSPFVPLTHLAMSSVNGKQGAFRSFSKWEKQDLEAEAMRKMRTKLQEQKNAEAAKNALLSAPPLSTSISAPAASGVSQSKNDEKPSIIVTPPSEASSQQSGMKPETTAPPANSIIFPKPAEQTGTKAPTISFGPPTVPSGVEQPPPILPSVSDPVKPASTGLGPGFPSSSPFSFAKPTQPQQATPTPNIFSQGTGSIPAASSNTTAPANSKPTFNFASTTPAAPQNAKPMFNFPATSGQSTTPGASSAPTPSFFSAPSSNPTPWKPQDQSRLSNTSAFPSDPKKTEQAPSTGGSSMLSRMGGFAPAAQAPSTTPSSGISFTKPNPPTTTPQNSPAPLPKFNFGIQNKPLGTNTGISTGPATPGSTLNIGSTTAQKPGPSPFGLPAKESTSIGGGTANTTMAPKFSFGMSSAPAAGGATGGSTPSNPFASQPFSQPNAFSTTPAGSPAAGNVLGGGNSGQTKTGNLFGGNTGSMVGTTSEAKPPLVINSTTPSSTPSTTSGAQNKPGAFTFQFGVAPGASSTSPFGAPKEGGSSTTPSSTFGQSTTPNVFGAPQASASSTAPMSSPFGQPTTPNVFGAPQTGASSNAPVSSAFGQTSNLFGASKDGATGRATTPATFGQPSSTSPSNLFGAPKDGVAGAPTKSAFGQPPSTSNPFGAPKDNVSGGAPTTSVFSQPSSTAPPSLFGAPKDGGASNTAPMWSGFGQASSTPSTTLFGATPSMNTEQNQQQK